MRRPILRSMSALAVLAGLIAGCVPYVVGSTARTEPAGEHTRTTSFFVIPNGVDDKGDSIAATVPGLDSEVRYGIDERSDWGVRVPSWSGVVLSYKRRLGEVPRGVGSDTGVAASIMVGAGAINWGQHAHLELSLIASGREDRKAVPYAGLRLMQVLPLSSAAPNDRPTAGGFLGWRIGGRDAGVAPEVGIFYDHSTLGLRRSDVIVVPSITIYDNALSSLFH